MCSEAESECAAGSHMYNIYNPLLSSAAIFICDTNERKEIIAVSFIILVQNSRLVYFF
jgi:hypothetical protein